MPTDEEVRKLRAAAHDAKAVAVDLLGVGTTLTIEDHELADEALTLAGEAHGLRRKINGLANRLREF